MAIISNRHSLSLQLPVNFFNMLSLPIIYQQFFIKKGGLQEKNKYMTKNKFVYY